MRINKACGTRGTKVLVGSLFVFVGLLFLSQSLYSLDFKTFLTPETKKTESVPFQEEVTDIIPYAAKLSRDYYDLKNKIKFAYELGKVRKRLEKVARDIEDLSIDIAFLGGNPHQNYNRLLYFNEELQETEKVLIKIDKSLSYTKKNLMKAREKWLNEKKKIPKLEALVERLGPLSVEKKALENLDGTIRNALMVVDERLRPILDVEQRLSDLRVKNHTLILEVNDWLRTYKGEILDRNAPSILSPAFLKQLNGDLW